MTLPARERSGPLGPLTIPAGETGEFRDLRPPSRTERIVLMTRTDQPGNLLVHRVLDNVESLHLAAIPLTAMGVDDDEDVRVLTYPIVGSLRVRFENAGLAAATVRVDAAIHST
jgi:hypothetical protein